MLRQLNRIAILFLLMNILLGCSSIPLVYFINETDNPVKITFVLNRHIDVLKSDSCFEFKNALNTIEIGDSINHKLTNKIKFEEIDTCIITFELPKKSTTYISTGGCFYFVQKFIFEGEDDKKEFTFESLNKAVKSHGFFFKTAYSYTYTLD